MASEKSTPEKDDTVEINKGRFSIRIRKKALVFMLLISCAASVLLLASADAPSTTPLHDLSLTDAVIRDAAIAYGLPVEQINVRTITVDSLFSRRDYELKIPRGFPATTVHARIVNELHPYGVKVYGKRTFPSNELTLWVTYAGKRIRTVKFSIDRDLPPATTFIP